MTERDIVDRLDELALLLAAPLSVGLQEQIRSHAKDEIRTVAAVIERLRAERKLLRGVLEAIYEDHMAYISGVKHPGASSSLSLNIIAQVRNALAGTEPEWQPIETAPPVEPVEPVDPDKRAKELAFTWHKSNACPGHKNPDDYWEVCSQDSKDGWRAVAKMMEEKHND